MATFKISDDELKALKDALKVGSDLITAAHYAKINPDDLLALLDEADSAQKTARQKEATRILGEIKSAKAEAILRAQEKVTQKMGDDWKAAAWWLERTLPEVYGKRGA